MSEGKKVEKLLCISLVLIIIAVSYFYVFVPFSQQVRGPAIDLTVSVKIDENGNIEKYSLEANMQDVYSYNELSKFVESQGFGTIKEYFNREIPSKTLFDYQYNSGSQKISFISTQSFDPNQEIPELKYDKQNWFYSDSLYKTEYFIPDKFINSINYKLDIPADISETNGEISQKKFGERKIINWEIDRHKESPDLSSKEVSIPVFYANTSTPYPTPGFGFVVLIIGLITAFILTNKDRKRIL